MDELTQNTSAWVEVLVDSPGAKTPYTYRMPENTAVRLGDVVSVPFGRSQVGGIAIRLLDRLPEGLDPSSIKSIESVVNDSFFTKEYWRLLVRVARYYQTPFIRVIRTALPPGLLSKSQRRIRLTQQYRQPKNQRANQQDPQALAEPLRRRIALDSASLAQALIATVKRSPTGDYSWQHVQRQLMRQGKGQSRKAVNQALRQLISAGAIESYLETPRSPQAQKRQAVFLVNSAPADSEESDLSKRQREILLGLEREGGELWLSDALQQLNTTSKTLKKIEAQGYLVVEPKEVLRAGSHSRALPDQPKQLTADQARSLSVLQQMQGYEEALLHGVTGSGKTEVYLQAIAPILKAQKSALVLVPEIGLTPQLTDRFRSRFGAQVCVYHSGLSEGERYDTWRQMLSGEPQVIIGTRSAVFSPLPNLGMIILDEEHDGSFKQEQPMPCYHARDVARWRAELEGCPLILGSATPSIETWVRFEKEEGESRGESRGSKGVEEQGGAAIKPPLHYLTLPMRVNARPAPPVEVVDMRKELHEGNRTIFSRPLQLALEELVEKGNQGILFIHRRGHSSFVSCRSCGHVMECPNCDVSLSFHQTHQNAVARLKCHYCGYAQTQPKECPACASPYLKHFGSGTQRVVNDLAKHLPQARCIRFDSDTTRNKGAHRALLTRFAQGEADLLVGTQMLTKGIDLPQVTLVGAIAADGLLFMPDYRASERAFQTLMQVAGRAGRGEQEGRVIVQTYSPEHVAVKALTQTEQGIGGASGGTGSQIEAYGTFLQAELRDRAEQQYPPYGKLVLLRLSGLDAALVERTAEQLAELLAAHLSNYRILGPVPAPIVRVARRYRWHILLKLSVEASLPDLKPLRRYCPKEISLTIDVEPLNLS